MASPSKRPKLDTWAVSEIQSESGHAAIRGVVTSLSPVKASRKNADVRYFEGKLCDGKKSIRLVSFNSRLRADMARAKDAHDTISLTNCQVKPASRYSDGDEAFELVATTHTKVLNSEVKYELGEIETSVDDAFKCLEDLSIVEGISVNQRVTVLAKVVDVSEPMTVQRRDDSKSLTKQDCIIADSASFRLSCCSLGE